jgi:hypothetical protein
MIAAALNWEDSASGLTGIVGIVIALLIFALTVLWIMISSNRADWAHRGFMQMITVVTGIHSMPVMRIV